MVSTLTVFKLVFNLYSYFKQYYKQGILLDNLGYIKKNKISYLVIRNLLKQDINIIEAIWVLFNLSFLFFLFTYFFYCCSGWGYIVAFTKDITMYQLYHTWVHLLHYFPLYLTLPIPGIVSTGSIFPITYMCAQYLHYIHLYTPFHHLFACPTVLTHTLAAGSVLPSCSPIL
jgi:hypothetical protein